MVSYKPSLSKIILIGLVVLAVFVPRATFAAMLAISPESGTYTVGQTFTATVRASSYTQSMNAVSGTLLYPADVLSIVSVSKNNSLLDTWLPPGSSGPVYTTGSGSIHFEGISLGGYKGAPKTIFSVTFKVKQSGVAKLTFQNGTILANDGKGTDITKALADASYKLAKAPAVAVGQTKPTTKTPTDTQKGQPVEVAVTPQSTPDVLPILPVASTTPERSYFGWILGGFGLLMFLVGALYARVIYLTQMVSNLQSRKKVAVRKKKPVFAVKKVTPRIRIGGMSSAKGVVNKF